MNARTPTITEIKELVDELVRLHQIDSNRFNYLEGLPNENLIEDALSVLTNRTILITDDYESDSPSYNGKTGIIFWGEVCFVSILITDKNGKLKIMNSESIEISGGDY